MLRVCSKRFTGRDLEGNVVYRSLCNVNLIAKCSATGSEPAESFKKLNKTAILKN